MEQPILSPAQQEELANLAEQMNDQLEEASQAAANQGFNMGCTVSLLPGLILVAAIFLITRGSGAVTAVVGVLVGIMVLILANLAAYLAKSRTMDRTYQRDIHPTIERALKVHEFSRLSFDQLANEVLPEAAALKKYLSVPEPDQAAAADEIQ